MASVVEVVGPGQDEESDGENGQHSAGDNDNAGDPHANGEEWADVLEVGALQHFY